jgi:hypothetical protein
MASLASDFWKSFGNGNLGSDLADDWKEWGEENVQVPNIYTSLSVSNPRFDWRWPEVHEPQQNHQRKLGPSPTVVYPHDRQNS